MPTSWHAIYAALCDALFIYLFIYLFKKSKKKKGDSISNVTSRYRIYHTSNKTVNFFLFTKSCYVYLTLDFSRNKNFLGTKEIVCVIVGSAQ